VPLFIDRKRAVEPNESGSKLNGAIFCRSLIVLIRSHRQESLSRAYIQAIASRCGLNCSFREFDYGIDVTVHLIQRRDNRYVESGFNLDIQAKSTFGATVTDNDILYDMEVKTYNDLRDPEVGTPRILVLLVQPEIEADWTGMTETELMLRRCAYWLSLKGQGATANTSTIRVSIPRTNRFSVEALQGIMERLRNGEDPQ
jgi:hypothetical protein